MSYTEVKVPALGDRVGMMNYIPGGDYNGLLIHVHGVTEKGSGSATDLEKVRLATLNVLKAGASGYGLLLCAIQTKNNGEYNEINEAIDYCLKTYPKINPKRVYLTGLSNGGGVVNKYIAENKDAHLKVAAAAPQCAGWNKYFFAAALTDQFAHTKVPVWASHAADDEVLKPAESTYPNVKMIQTAGGKAVMTIYKTGGHNGCYSKTYSANKPGLVPATVDTATEFNDVGENMFDWLIRNEVGKPPVLPYTVAEKKAATTPPVESKPPVTDIPTTDGPIIEQPDPAKIFLKNGFNGGGVVGEVWWRDGSKVDLTLDGEKPKTLHWIVDFIDTATGKGLLRLSVEYPSGRKQGIGPRKIDKVVEEPK